MKLLLSLLMGLLLIPVSKADVVTATFTTNQTQCLVTNNVVIDSIQLSAGSALFQLELYDTPSTTLTYVNSAYTNRVPTVTNLVTTVVTETGLTNIFTNKVLMTLPVVVAAATNSYTKVAAFAVAANESSVVSGPFLMSQGITLKNVSGGTNSYAVIVNYHPQSK